jgi:tyrosyl-tRNA synthetase
VQLYDRYGCELQLGGSDQWGNITEGVDLIRRLRNARAFGLTSPLITRSDGSKFGKTEGDNVWLDPARTSPYAFYQFWIGTADPDVGSYLRRLTFLPKERIEELDAATAERPERREAQRALAFEVTASVHGRDEAHRAETAAAVLFTEDIASLDAATLAGALTDAPTTTIERSDLGDGLDVLTVLLQSHLAESKSQARRLLSDGAVYVNGARVDPERRLVASDALHGRWIVLRRGKAQQHVLLIQD